MKKLIIEARITEFADRERNRNVPWTAEEIGQDAEACRKAGASIIHFHARKDDGSPAHDTKTYAKTIAAIRERTDVLIHSSLGQITLSDPIERIAHIKELSRDKDLRPDFASVDTGSTNIDGFDFDSKRFLTGNKVYVNSIDTLQFFLRSMRECGVKPALCMWTVSFTRTAQAFMEMGLLDEPAYMLFLLTGGNFGGHPVSIAGLRAHIDFLPKCGPYEWTVASKPGNLFAVAAASIAEGGHIAIGIGDNPYNELGEPTNAEVIHEIAHMASLLGREVATPEDTRRILGMN